MPPLHLYARVHFLCARRTRDRGCSAHPAFPAPSDFFWARCYRKIRAFRAAGSRRCVCCLKIESETACSVIARSACDEAIHSFFVWRDGLLRYARNDEEGASAPYFFFCLLAAAA